MNDNDKKKLEDVLDAVDRARTKLEIGGLQLAAMGLKDHEAVARLRAASAAAKEARAVLLTLRTA